MARHLDLEEQEQLEELKHFWNQWGNLITWTIIVVCGAFAAWNGWEWWQRRQAVQAAALYDEVDRAAATGNTALLQTSVKDIEDKFGRTAYAAQAALLGAKVFADKGQPDAARAALQWVAGEAKDEGYQAVARLRLASLLADSKSYDDALKQLSGSFPKDFQPLVADRRGDIYRLQGKNAEARTEYTKAWQGLAGAEYRTLVEVKLTALGVDVQTLKPAETAKS